MDTKLKKPYITILENNGSTYIGILKIKSKQYISLYNLSYMDDEDQKLLLDYAEEWWWQSNRGIPISLFMQEEMEYFEKYITRLNTDDCTVISGPLISLLDLPTKRIKRRNITLKKK